MPPNLFGVWRGRGFRKIIEKKEVKYIMPKRKCDACGKEKEVATF